MSCTLHDVQLPQSARASITRPHVVAISWRSAVGDAQHLLVGAVLDRMLDVDGRRLRAQRASLMLRTIHEREGGDEDRGDAARFQINRVVHTARRATPSIGEGFDRQLTGGRDLLPQIDRSRLGERRLPEALDGRAAGDQMLLDPIQKKIAPWLGNVEQTDRQAPD